MMAVVMLALSACNPNDPNTPEVPAVPSVDVTVLSATSSTVTARFDMNDECQSYTILISEDGSMSQWMQMFGATLEECVSQWGLTFSKDSTYTWKELTPNTDYQIYYIVKGKDSSTKLDSVAVKTAVNGGSGESVVTIAVDQITDSSARVTCTPNSETALFKDMLIVKDSFNVYGADAVLDMLKQDVYVYYETDVWTWSLDAGTEYYALAVGQNANGDWGSMTTELFSTLSGKKGGLRMAKGIITRKR